MASRDYEEFIAAFNRHGVRYLIVGAHGDRTTARNRPAQLTLLVCHEAGLNASISRAATLDGASSGRVS
jgi:hypothetical protein